MKAQSSVSPILFVILVLIVSGMTPSTTPQTVSRSLSVTWKQLTGSQSSSLAISTQQRASAIAAGYWHTCALVGGEVKCWGANDFGGLGDGTTVDRLSPVDVCADLGCSSPLSAVGAITAGYWNTCALANGEAKCWGLNDVGQLGDSTTVDRLTPADVCADVGCTSLISGVRAIASGWDHACALTANGRVKCWGANDQGQLGDGTTTSTSTPVDVCADSACTSPLSSVISISAGAWHTCALTTGGQIKCWGNNAWQELGDGTIISQPPYGRLTPVDVCADSACTSPLTGVVSISAGNTHTCALMSSGGVKCWGNNRTGQLGDGTTTSTSIPVNVCANSTCTSPLSNVSEVTAGNVRTCALISSGGVKCWGDNEFGGLGDGTTTSSNTPVNVCRDQVCSSSLSGVTVVSAGATHTCALTTDGGVKCWGANDFGGLGDGTTTDRHTPVDVVFPSISGRLTTIDNTPIPEAVVEMIPDSGADDLRQTTTDASGFYTFTIAASGTYTVTPWPAKFTFAPDSYAYSPAWIQVKASPSAINQNFTGIPIQDSIAVRPLRQVDLPWGKHHLDSTNLPISGLGCLLTSWTMVINYFGLYNGFQPNPIAVNDSVTTDGGFGIDGNLDSFTVAKYARDHGVNIYLDDFVPTMNPVYVDEMLSQGTPVILQEQGVTMANGVYVKQHYVLAIGKIIDGGDSTYAIIDPYYNTSSLKSYGSKYTGYFSYELKASGDVSAIYLSVASPVQLLVTDPEGRRTGYDPVTGQTLNEIPNSTYITDTLADATNPLSPTLNPKVFWARGVISGTYKTELVGTDVGSYTLDLIGHTQSGAINRQTIVGQTAPGKTTTYIVPYSPTGGLGPIYENAVYLPVIIR